MGGPAGKPRPTAGSRLVAAESKDRRTMRESPGPRTAQDVGDAAAPTQAAAPGVSRSGPIGVPPPAKTLIGRWTSWIRGHGQVLWETALAVAIAVLATVLTRDLELGLAKRQELQNDKLANQAEMLENVRFVRQVVIGNPEVKPFRGLRLADADLSGLNLGCHQTARRVGCADFVGADLSGASLVGTDLSGAVMRDANLDHADLARADLSRTDLTRAKLRGANLRGANLEDIRFEDVCYDSSTVWPVGEARPAPVCP